MHHSIIPALYREQPYAVLHPQHDVRRRRPNSSRLYFFGRNKQEDNDNNNNNDETSKAAKTDDSTKEKNPFNIPFFGRPTTVNEKRSNDVKPLQDATPLASTSTKNGSAAPKRQEDSNDPVILRAKAERVRLEAERMDAELTLSKIDRLEKQLVKTKSKGDSIDDLQRQLDALQAKLRGEPPPTTPVVSNKPTAQSPLLESPAPSSESLIEEMSAAVRDQDVIEAARKMSGRTDFEISTEDDIKMIPGFLLKMLATVVAMDYNNNDVESIDKTEFLRRWEMAKNLDYSFDANYTTPTFTSAQISKAKEEIQGRSSNLFVTDRMIEKAGGNATQLALYALEFDEFLNRGTSRVGKMNIQDIAPDFLQDLFNQTAGDAYLSALYPKCTRKEGEEPTQAQVDALVRTVLVPAKFSTSSKPIKVAGGYAITGTHKYKNGDDLIDAIDRELAKTSLADKLTVLYAPGTQRPLNSTVLTRENIDSLEPLSFDFLDDIDVDPEPILYILGPNIVRDSNRLGLTITSILGIATSWYLSIYPFLLNDGIGKRVDDELQLLEANLQPDLTWLTDLSFPLFVTFIALQLVHEAAHRLVAATNGVKLTVPTFVPSLITGITSSVTTFKTLPKNKEAMFDISAAGPLAGIVASSVALAVGSKLTLISDPSTLPALPLDILRQSTLGGAIIDNIIQGSLYVPEGAPTAGIMISLHPIAIAGYISLVVNALSLLPIGSKSPRVIGRCIVVSLLGVLARSHSC
jgi:hypothetical protein